MLAACFDRGGAANGRHERIIRVLIDADLHCQFPLVAADVEVGERNAGRCVRHRACSWRLRIPADHFRYGIMLLAL